MKYLSLLCTAAIVSGVVAIATPSIAQLEAIDNNIKYVPSGEKRHFWFLVAVDVDCTTKLEIIVRVDKPPSNGKIQLVPGEGFGFWPPDNPRHNCNTKKVKGLNLFYQSNPKFAGEDEFSLFVLWPEGQARQVNYKIYVVDPSKPEPQKKTEEQPPKPVIDPVKPMEKHETAVKTQNIEFIAISGEKWTGGHMADLNPDCTIKSGITVKVEKPPSNGKFEAVPGEGYTR